MKKILVMGQPQVTHVTGGAITVFNDFCNMLSDNYDVIGCCSSDINARPVGLSEKIKFVNLYFQYVGKNYSKACNLLMEDEKPDLIVFFFLSDYLAAKLDNTFKSIPRVLMFHSRPDWYLTKVNSLNIFKNIYTNTTAQILLPSFYKLLPDFIKKDNVVCIPNYIKKSNLQQNSELEKKKFVYLSRIDSAKGHEFLIRSFALIAHKYPDWQLDIYGQSEPPIYEEKLKKQVEKFKLSEKIHFMGVTQTPLEVLQNYDFCVFPSWFEGFPMGLSDAQSVGLAAIGFKGCSGVNELIIDGKNGFLADDNIEDFAQKIELLITNKTLRKKMSKEAFSGTLQYSVEDWAEKWNNVITAILSKKKIPYQIKQDCNCPYEIFTLEKIETERLDAEKKLNFFSYRKEYKLFNFLPLFKFKQRGGNKVWKVFGIPVWRVRKMSNGSTVKYYLFGLPFLKIENK